MIGKICKPSTGSSANRIRYIYGAKKHDHDLVGIKTIDTNCFAFFPEIGMQKGSAHDLDCMILDMDVATKLKIGEQGQPKRNLKPIFHAVLSLDVGESLTDEQWRLAVRHYLKEMGFSASNKYAAVLHSDTGNQHVHVVANRIRYEPGFKMVDDKNNFELNLQAVSDIECMFGLRKALRPEESWNVSVRGREVQGSARANAMPYRSRLAARVGACVESTKERDGDIVNLVRALRRQGVYVHLRYDSQGQPKGIAYEFEGRVTSGKALKKARFTFQKLTSQEGIRYEPYMLIQLQTEISKRVPTGKGKSYPAEQRYWVNRGWIYMYFVPENTARAPFIRLKVKRTGAQVRQEIEHEEAMALIRAILQILAALFGAGAGYSAKPGNPRVKGYAEYDQGKEFPLLLFKQPDDDPLHPPLSVRLSPSRRDRSQNWHE
ncbi:relaxase/mobilization nuclease domain-containing protein [Pseudomonas putida]|uniref:relaxase/mobilization nuclease domain-containing protein n=1 Tax=Pseudomonas putida TaxID=303 RepID=UPI002363EB53|nr:relaxase/mobilization nuclease domain-containing protein [Pseudomonas putida]MDD1990127.1 relaxase/mobilization nuclease domain-containing protein [Pseudomonas putida]HDS1794468.1 relaxase/mobilization nuclease domain-containing protein [Pseudomonas putida]